MNAFMDCEHPDPREAELIAEMTELTERLQKRIDGRGRRTQHAKTTGCVEASFQIHKDIPEELRHGIFRTPGASYDALIRFSNAKGTFANDGKATARGMAIKVLNVAGERSIPGDRDTTQDFLLVNHPVFPFPNPQEYVATMRRTALPVIGGLAAILRLLLFRRGQLKIIQEIQQNTINNPLEPRYWSNSPFWLGTPTGEKGQAVKYIAAPQDPPVAASATPESENFLLEALIRHLSEKDATFIFYVQKHSGDDAKTPIEDVSQEWKEVDSPRIPVATLRIKSQKAEQIRDLMAQCETMSFTPWHALADHRPVGGMNRLRRSVYEASFSERSSDVNKGGGLAKLATALLWLVVAVHVAFAGAELIPWGNAYVLHKIDLGLPTETFPAVSRIVHNAGIYNLFFAATLFVGICKGKRGFGLQAFCLIFAMFAGIFGAYTLTCKTLLAQTLPAALALGAIVLRRVRS